MRSTMSHQFSRVPKVNIPRSVFDRSCTRKMTMDAGYLYPMFVDEALPGDTFKLRTHTFGRFSTPLFPIMDNIFIDIFYFAVPNRLLWENWERFNGEQDNPGDSTDFTMPVVVDSPASTYTVAQESLGDYLGLPTQVPLSSEDGVDSGIRSDWHTAYNLIWNDWFRDENLQDSVVVDRTDGPHNSADYVLLRRGKRHDYFTSALPWPQKAPDILLPLGSEAPVLGIGKVNQNFTGAAANVYETGQTGTTAYALNDNALINGGAVDGQFRVEEDPNNAGFPYIRADLSLATAATINDLREAFQIQKLFEKDARGGTRYTEIVRAHFNVVSDDARLQRPEFLGGGSTRLQFIPVAQTSESGTTPQGTLTGFATFAHDGVGFTKSFTEHCVILGLVNVRADLTYQQGVPRMFSRSTRFDFYWPSLAHIGEQEILSREIYADGSANDYDPFGYQERYAEYRYKNSEVVSLFRSNATGSLDAWHLSQDFATRPTLSNTFIEDNPPMDRIVAVPAEPKFIMDMRHELRCARPMPIYSVPGLIDHF